MAEKLLQELLEVEITGEFRDFFIQNFENYAVKNNCSVEKFALYFWEFVKAQTEDFTKINSSACNTPKKLALTSANVRQQSKQIEQTPIHVSLNEALPIERHNISRELFSPGQNVSLDDASPTIFNKNSSRNFEENSLSNSSSKEFEQKGRRSTELNSRRERKGTILAFNERETNIMTTSTPVGGNSKRNLNSNSTRKSTGNQMCLGDFMIGPMKTKRRSLGNELKNVSNPSSTTTTTTGNESPAQLKPKKRVAPITLSKNVNDSFRNTPFASASDHNFTSKGKETNERTMLKLHKESIANDFIQQSQEQNTKSLHAAFKDKVFESTQITPLEIDLTKTTQPHLIQRLADIFSLLLDLNLSINILTEISYLVNLINTEVDPFTKDLEVTDPGNILKNLNNCIYFALCTLSRLKHLLIMLDVKTINVLMKNDRILMNDKELHKFLTGIFQYKSNLSTKLIDGNNVPGYSYVFYQQENDSKGNFPTEKEFGAFKKQRDMFYAILKSWEQKHLNPSFDFTVEYGPKVRSLLGIIDHPINMAHLAKLFTAQLIISCNFDQSASELQMVLPSIDLTKLSKLRQRLVAPSIFSTQYLFPGNQAFFQDFIIACDNHAVFLEQLKLALISELLEMNDATYCTHVDIECSIEGLDMSKRSTLRSNSETDQIIQPSTIITMRVLAKFIGFVTSRPYTYDNRNFVVDERQIQLRNLLLPTFDIKSVILKSVLEKKLLVTIPWIVQYLHMLDYVSLCLNYYKEIFRILYKLYTEHNGTSLVEAFVLRACLGWLFEHCSLTHEYFSYRTETQVPLNFDKTLVLRYEKDSLEGYLSPNFEHIIVAACPFLADLRVSIMPSRFEKQLSRTGRFRHITTTQTTSNTSKVQGGIDGHSKLTEAFLQSQSLSLRRIVEFVVERVTSAVVKDFQYKYLIPIKSEVTEEVKMIKSTDSKIVAKEMHEKYLKSFASLSKLWDETVSDAVNVRCKQAFDALLPIETIENVKKTCISLSTEKILQKINNWRASYMKSTEIFSKTIRTDAERLAKANSTEIEHQTAFSLQLSENLPSNFFYTLHEMQHNASIQPDKITKESFLQFLETTNDILLTQTFTTNLYRTTGTALLYLIQTLIVMKPDLMDDDEILTASNNIWKIEKFTPLIMPTPTQTPSEEIPDENLVKKRTSKNIFANLISSRLILQLNESPTRDYTLKCLLKWLKSLICSQLITIDRLSEMFVSLFQHEWDNDNLQKIRYLSKSLSEFRADVKFKDNLLDDNDEKSNLFLDLVADLSINLEI